MALEIWDSNMAEIPSDIPASAAQAGYQAREVGRARDARSAATANASNQRARAVDEAGNTVDTEDNDNQVFADAEGSGGRGRPFEEGNPTDDPDAGEESKTGVTKDDDGQLHIDLEA
ncbi:MAG: hypothetical protein IH987_15265 [Planctomycetes bacterium]|nr:hypothetical protein [Planctomycetota bacterium]